MEKGIKDLKDQMIVEYPLLVYIKNNNKVILKNFILHQYDIIHMTYVNGFIIYACVNLREFKLNFRS